MWHLSKPTPTASGIEGNLFLLLDGNVVISSVRRRMGGRRVGGEEHLHLGKGRFSGLGENSGAKSGERGVEVYKEDILELIILNFAPK